MIAATTTTTAAAAEAQASALLRRPGPGAGVAGNPPVSAPGGDFPPGPHSVRPRPAFGAQPGLADDHLARGARLAVYVPRTARHLRAPSCGTRQMADVIIGEDKCITPANRLFVKMTGRSGPGVSCAIAARFSCSRCEAPGRDRRVHRVL